MKKRLTMVLAGLSLGAGVSMAQSELSGTVVSSEDGQPVIGASVVIEGSKTGTVTDVDGHFSLNVPPGKKLTVKYLGMETKTVPARNNIRITLNPDNKTLKEVVVTGMSTMDRRMFSGAVSQIDANDAIIGGLTDISRSLEDVQPASVSRTFPAPSVRRRRSACAVPRLSTVTQSRCGW